MYIQSCNPLDQLIPFEALSDLQSSVKASTAGLPCWIPAHSRRWILEFSIFERECPRQVVSHELSKGVSDLYSEELEFGIILDSRFLPNILDAQREMGVYALPCVSSFRLPSAVDDIRACLATGKVPELCTRKTEGVIIQLAACKNPIRYEIMLKRECRKR